MQRFEIGFYHSFEGELFGQFEKDDRILKLQNSLDNTYSGSTQDEFPIRLPGILATQNEQIRRILSIGYGVHEGDLKVSTNTSTGRDEFKFVLDGRYHIISNLSSRAIRLQAYNTGVFGEGNYEPAEAFLESIRQGKSKPTIDQLMAMSHRDVLVIGKIPLSMPIGLTLVGSIPQRDGELGTYYSETGVTLIQLVKVKGIGQFEYGFIHPSYFKTGIMPLLQAYDPDENAPSVSQPKLVTSYIRELKGQANNPHSTPPQPRGLKRFLSFI